MRKKFFPYRKFSLAFLGLIVVVLTASVLRDAWQVNAWSLAFARPALAKGLESSVVTSQPPVAHRRAPIWLVQQALENEKLQKVQSWISILQGLAGDDVFAARVLGKVWWMQGHSARAIRLWFQARDYHALLNAAWQAQEAGRLDDALNAYRVARVVNPRQGTLPLANYLWQQYQGRGAAEALLRQALVQYPTSTHRVSWLRRLGEMLRGEKRWDEALALYRKLLDENPNDWRAHIGLGWVFYDSGNGASSAAAEFQQAIALAPERGEGYLAMGQLLVQEGRYAEADSWFAQAIQRNSNMKRWWLEWANAVRFSGNYNDALKLYRRVIEQFPDWAPVYYEIAWTYRQMNRPDDAVQSLEIALALAHTSRPRYLVYAGDVYEWVGKVGLAVTYYRQVLFLDPQNVAAQQGIERLGK